MSSVKSDQQRDPTAEYQTPAPGNAMLAIADGTPGRLVIFGLGTPLPLGRRLHLHRRVGRRRIGAPEDPGKPVESVFKLVAHVVVRIGIHLQTFRQPGISFREC